MLKKSVRIMNNPLVNAPLDSGVHFIAFLWEECKAELEELTQQDVNDIAKVVRRRTSRKFFVKTSPLSNIVDLEAPKKKAPKKKSK